VNLYAFIYKKVYKKLPLTIRVFARDVYFTLKYGSRDMFVTIGMDLSSKCNLKCKYCPNYHIGGKGDNYMSKELFHKIINELAGIDYHGNVSIPALYAEPLLDEGLVSKLSYIRGKLPKARVIVFTNATKLTVKKYLELVNAGVDRLIVTGHDDFGKRNIELLKEFLEGETERIIEYISLDMNNLVNRGGTVPLVNVKLLDSCVDPSRYLSITYDGKVLICCNDYLEETVLGNLQSESLMSVWRKDKYKKLRSDIKHGIFNLRICQVCGYGKLPKRLMT